MRFANLLWALSTDERPHYRIAAAIGCSEARFSRCLSGRASFSDSERKRLAGVLGYRESWLFHMVKPRVESDALR
jgi:hypothetical protein